MSAKGDKLECGCVVGYYWCWRHDIYVKQDPKDPAWRVADVHRDERSEERTCTCFISAPCSFCTNETERDE